MEHKFRRTILLDLLIDTLLAVATALGWLAYILSGHYGFVLVVALVVSVASLGIVVLDVRNYRALQALARQHEATIAEAWYAMQAEIDPGLETAEWKQAVTAYYESSIAPPYYYEPWA